MALCSCKFLPHNTSVSGAGVSLTHPQDIQTPPRISTDTNTDTVDIPAGAKITISEVAEVPAKEKNPAIPSHKDTIIELPKDHGAKIVSLASKVAAIGSGGFAPSPPPTPFQSSLRIWSYVGAAIFVLGIYFCTPYGGSNPRCGAIVAAGGIGMAISASLLDQFKLPGWFPVVFLIFLLLALAVYYGYRVRHAQITSTQNVKPQ